jgi:WD40 repeat protein
MHSDLLLVKLITTSFLVFFFLFGLALVIVAPRSWKCETQAQVVNVLYTPDEDTIAVLRIYHSVELWNTKAEKAEYPYLSIPQGYMPQNIAYPPDGKTVAVAALAPNFVDSIVQLWDPHTHTVLHTLTGHQYQIGAMSYSTDSNFLLTSSYDGTARIWDVESGNLIHTLAGDADVLLDARYSPDERTVLTVGQDGTAILWSTKTGDQLHTLTVPGSISKAVYSPDSRLVAVGSTDNNVYLFDTQTALIVRVLQAHTEPVTDVAFSPNSENLVTGSLDESAIVWNVNTGKPIYRLAHNEPVFSVLWSTANTIFSGGHDYLHLRTGQGSGKFWNPESGELLHTLPYMENGVYKATYSEDGSKLITFSPDAQQPPILWDTTDYQMLRPLCPLILGHKWFEFGCALVVSAIVVFLKTLTHHGAHCLIRGVSQAVYPLRTLRGVGRVMPR